MRIEQLEYVTALTEYGSLRRASVGMHVSQPALSDAVAKLERELGVTLFDRSRHGSSISPAGRDLLPHMLAVLDAVEDLRTAASTATGEVELAAP